MRVVLDTNVLIDGSNDDFSAAAQLIDAVHEGALEALATPATIREYRRILQRLITDEAYQERVQDFIAATTPVTPERIDIQIDDEEDYKFIQAAVGGGAQLLITSDRHLLQVGEVGTTRMVTPQEAWVLIQEEKGDSSEWQRWASGLGIGA